MSKRRRGALVLTTTDWSSSAEPSRRTWSFAFAAARPAVSSVRWPDDRCMRWYSSPRTETCSGELPGGRSRKNSSPGRSPARPPGHGHGATPGSRRSGRRLEVAAAAVQAVARVEAPALVVLDLGDGRAHAADEQRGEPGEDEARADRLPALVDLERRRDGEAPAVVRSVVDRAVDVRGDVLVVVPRCRPGDDDLVVVAVVVLGEPGVREVRVPHVEHVRAAAHVGAVGDDRVGGVAEDAVGQREHAVVAAAEAAADSVPRRDTVVQLPGLDDVEEVADAGGAELAGLHDVDRFVQVGARRLLVVGRVGRGVEVRRASRTPCTRRT